MPLTITTIHWVFRSHLQMVEVMNCGLEYGGSVLCFVWGKLYTLGKLIISLNCHTLHYEKALNIYLHCRVLKLVESSSCSYFLNHAMLSGSMSMQYSLDTGNVHVHAIT